MCKEYLIYTKPSSFKQGQVFSLAPTLFPLMLIYSADLLQFNTLVTRQKPCQFVFHLLST